jgi:hypothetical protein
MCLLESAFAFVYRTMPTRESMLGITSQDEPIDTIKITTLKRKKSHIVSNIASMKLT